MKNAEMAHAAAEAAPDADAEWRKEAFFGSVLHVARVVIEAASPLSVGGAGRDPLTDVALQRDANGLPAIPGASIAGVLRHLGGRVYKSEPDWEKRLFGWIAPNRDEGAPARLTFGWGRVHDSKDAPVCGLRADLDQDDLLRWLASNVPMTRDHVALDHRGVAERNKKFDRSAVPRGARFSFDISLWGLADESEQKEDRKALEELAGLVAHPLFGLGGGARRGYGRAALVGATVRSYNLVTEDLAKRRARCRAVRFARDPSPRADASDPEIQSKPLTPLAASGAGVEINLEISPIGFWRVGSGDIPFASAENESADLLMLTEPFIRDGRVISPKADDENAFLVLPGSAIKGTLAHRTLFHFNRRLGLTIDADGDEEAETAKLTKYAKRNAALARLFGAPRGPGKDDAGSAARLIIEDCIVELARGRIAKLDHVCIDRFTQGVITGALYAEEAAWKGTWPLLVRIDPIDASKSCLGFGDDVWEAFACALDDLCKGRVAIGAKSMGFARCEQDWRAQLPPTLLDAPEGTAS